jgi:hypothetical protein
MIHDLLKTLRDHRKPLLLLALTWGVYFTALFSRILEMKPEGIYGGHVNVWADWSLHIGMVNLFAHKSPGDWFAYHPLYSEGRFTYPFLTNLLSGLLVRCGISLIPAMTIPSIVYSFGLLAGLYLFSHALLRSRRQAVLVVFLFLLSSGPGIIRYAQDLVSHFSWKSVWFPPQDYSRIDDRQWYAGNVIEGLLAPQRACLLGMATALWALYATFRGLDVWGINPRLGRKYWVLAGVLVGLLPFTHVHSLIAISPGLALVLLWRTFRNPKSWRDLFYLGLPAVSLASIYYVFFLRGGIQVQHFQTWAPGWMAEGGFRGWISLWLRIWGIAIPLALFAFVRWASKRDSASAFAKIFVGSFFVLFGLSNLILFQPIAWDNSKIFFWCYLVFGVPTAVLLDDLARAKRRWSVATAAVLLFALTATGLMETYRIQWIEKNQLQMTNLEDIQLGEKIRNTAGPRDVFLTSTDHNQFIMMWGVRPILLGFTAWVWNYGLNYDQAERDLKKIYLGDGEAKALLARHHIRYVVIGSGERRNFKSNDAFFDRTYPLAFSNRNYRIYDVTSSRAP